MERLTNKIGSEEKHYNTDQVYKSFDKLGKLEDLEEEIGCPLEVLFRALNDGFYRKGLFDDSLYYFEKVYIENGWLCEKQGAGEVLISEYKKTWWLKEDRSE